MPVWARLLTATAAGTALALGVLAAWTCRRLGAPCWLAFWHPTAAGAVGALAARLAAVAALGLATARWVGRSGSRWGAAAPAGCVAAAAAGAYGVFLVVRLELPALGALPDLMVLMAAGGTGGALAAWLSDRL